MKRWNPCCSLKEEYSQHQEVVDGRVSKVWKNLWPSIRVFFLQLANEHAKKTYLVFEKERDTFQEILNEAVKCAAIFRDVYKIKKDPEQADKIEPIAPDLKHASGTSGYLIIQDHEGKGFWEGMNTWSTMLSKHDIGPNRVLEDDPQVSPDDDAMIIFMSGTTGLPKCALSMQELPWPKGMLFDEAYHILLHQFQVHGSRFTGTSQGIKLVLMQKWNVEEVAPSLAKRSKQAFPHAVFEALEDYSGGFKLIVRLDLETAPLRAKLYQPVTLVSCHLMG
ncbi:hypothetical protein IW261DRAFT_1418402 [Armillaria novae-zelandiae]|uniref:Uncharacterized protein n=1 Tax=Armillaria novae-zelandiae TaxID=153914 RepID=A0AA39PCF1_9AGAR|nr:hypothetical protein IW261DRAFT_1418402 [Armillaria novae-zelandiae]